MTGTSLVYTGDPRNILEIEALGVHIINHPTQPAAILFYGKTHLDPIGTIQIGQTLEVDGPEGTRIVGVADRTAVAPVKDEQPASHVDPVDTGDRGVVVKTADKK